MLVALFLLTAYPMAMNTWENKGREATESVLTLVTRLYLVLCLPAAVGLTVLSRPFVALLTDETYYQGYRIVGFVAFSNLRGQAFIQETINALIDDGFHTDYSHFLTME